jgi:hypothetical protein
MTSKERRWKYCMDWFNANPNVKSYFIKAFTRVGRDNPFYEMERACKAGQLFNTTRRLIDQELSGIERYYLVKVRVKMIDYCRSRE